jgi:hypothetical protein
MGLKLRLVSGQSGLVLAYRAIGKLRTVWDGIARAIREALRPRPCSIVGGLATDLLRTRAELVAENALLRQQLVVVARRVKRPIFRRHERAAVALLTAALPRITSDDTTYAYSFVNLCLMLNLDPDCVRALRR